MCFREYFVSVVHRAFLVISPILTLSSPLLLASVAMSTKPKNEASVLDVVQTERPQRRRNGRKRKGKGQGRKRNPCLRKYKNYCIHGTCLYLKDIHQPSCV